MLFGQVSPWTWLLVSSALFCFVLVRNDQNNLLAGRGAGYWWLEGCTLAPAAFSYYFFWDTPFNPTMQWWGENSSTVLLTCPGARGWRQHQPRRAVYQSDPCQWKTVWAELHIFRNNSLVLATLRSSVYFTLEARFFSAHWSQNLEAAIVTAVFPSLVKCSRFAPS